MQVRIRNIIYWYFIFSVFICSNGCNPITSNSAPISANIDFEPEKTSKVKSLEKQIKDKPAVIYRSQDMGLTWSPFAKGIPKDATLSGIKQYSNKVYIATDYHGIFVFTEEQDSWKEMGREYLKELDINCIEVESNNLIIGTLKQGILVSQDGGLSWSPSKENINSPIRAFLRFENTIYAGTDAGIFKSSDEGETWSHVFGQLQILGFTTLKEKIYAATQNGALMTDGSDKNWRSIYKGDALHDIGNDGRYIYAMTIGQQLLKTKDEGESWVSAQNGISRPPNYYTNELRLVGNKIFTAQWIGIYQSLDNGSSWSIVNGLPDSTAFSTLEITDFGIIAGISIR